MQETQRLGFDPWVGKIPWKRKWQPFPVFWPENPMDRGAWQATVHGFTKSWTWLNTCSQIKGKTASADDMMVWNISPCASDHLIIFFWECSNYRTTALITHTSKVMLKILQDRLQQYINHELPDVQAGFRKGRETRNQIANICWITEEARKFQKNIYFCVIDYASLCVDHNKLWKKKNCGKFLNRWEYQWEYQITWPASWEICIQVKK